MARNVERLLAVTGMLIALAIGGTAASASTMSFEPAGRITSVSEGPMVFEAEGMSIECNVSLEGTLQRSFSMVSGTQFGSMTAARATECRNGTITFLVPGPFVYGSLLGPLENPRGILFWISNLQVLVSVPVLFSCLYEIRGGALIGYREGPGTVTTEITMLPREQEIIRSTKLSGLLGCPRGILVNGRLSLSPQQRVTIR